jgi:hypothetical protein
MMHWVGNALKREHLPATAVQHLASYHRGTGEENENANVANIEATINTFLRLLFSIKDKRRFKSLLNDFCKVCNASLAPDVFVSYELS